MGGQWIVDLEFLTKIVGIILLDLVLSGDNAVVIGMAARSLPPVQRRRAIIFGGGAAIGLRILFTLLASVLLQIPLLEAAGGVLLVWVAIKLLRDRGGAEENVREGRNILDAIRVIVVADVVMSLDNMISVAAVADEERGLLLFGLLLSIPLLLLGSNLVATMMNRMPWLVWAGSLILAVTAGRMIVHDEIVHRFLTPIPQESIVVPALVTALVVGVALRFDRREGGRGEYPAADIGASGHTR